MKKDGWRMTGEVFQPLPSKQATISDTKQQSLIAASIVSDDTIAPRSLTMDFSSVNRSLESLHRRRPELDAEVLDLATALLQQDVSADDYLASLVKLLEAQDRWEPLAVGLYVATNMYWNVIQMLLVLSTWKVRGFRPFRPRLIRPPRRQHFRNNSSCSYLVLC